MSSTESDVTVLAFEPDMFGGVIVESDTLPEDAEAFQADLHHSLEIWRSSGVRLVWIPVPIQRAALIPVAVAAGFTFHHTNDDALMLVHRLVEDAFVPYHATHYIGVGGVVLNTRQELLVVCEKHRRTKQPYYKLPGGALQPGEHLVEAVTREVLEETGVETKFEALVCFRHWHGYRYGKSDIYFVCRLSPLSEDVTMQTEEIEECFWMPVADYFASDLVSVFNKRIVKAALSSQGVTPEWIDGYADPTRYEFFMPREAT
ncbi:MAG TPA: NUDIX domain-containing protein [Chloroflexota bacterium]|nr:NUDIX domain-containing protein [Chloroflexota bacterium]